MDKHPEPTATIQNKEDENTAEADETKDRIAIGLAAERLPNLSVSLADIDEVLSVFTQFLDKFGRKWAEYGLKIEGKTETQEDAWKLARKLAKVIAITQENLSNAGGALLENVVQDFPDSNIKELKDILSPNMVHSTAALPVKVEPKDILDQEIMSPSTSTPLRPKATRDRLGSENGQTSAMSPSSVDEASLLELPTLETTSESPPAIEDPPIARTSTKRVHPKSEDAASPPVSPIRGSCSLNLPKSPVSAAENASIDIVDSLVRNEKPALKEEDIESEIEMEKDKFNVLKPSSSDSTSDSEMDDAKDLDYGVVAEDKNKRDAKKTGKRDKKFRKKKKKSLESQKTEDKDLKSAKRQVLQSSSDSDNDDDRKPPFIKEEKEEETMEAKLKSRFKFLMAGVDVPNDLKLKSQVEVRVAKLGINLVDVALQRPVNISEFDELQTPKTPRKKRDRDPEIERLCNLGALNTKYFNKKHFKTTKTRNKANPSNGPELESHSDSSDGPSPPKNGPDFQEEPSGEDRLKRAVLDTSDETESEPEDIKNAAKTSVKKKKMKLDASETKSKSEPEPKFMRVKLDASDASDDDAKAAKREEKIQAEREARKKRRMLSSSEEELDLKNAGSQKPKNDTLSKLSKADSDQSDWSSDGGDGKKAKNKLDISSDSDIELAPAKRKRKLRKSSSSSSSSSDDTDSDEKDRPKAKKRKRIKKNSSSEGEDGGDDDDDDDDDANQSKGRKNIHRIISDKKVSVSTKEAAIDEKERRKRMEERQKKYNELFKVSCCLPFTGFKKKILFNSKKKKFSASLLQFTGILKGSEKKTIEWHFNGFFTV